MVQTVYGVSVCKMHRFYISLSCWHEQLVWLSVGRKYFLYSNNTSTAVILMVTCPLQGFGSSLGGLLLWNDLNQLLITDHKVEKDVGNDVIVVHEESSQLLRRHCDCTQHKSRAPGPHLPTREEPEAFRNQRRWEERPSCWANSTAWFQLGFIMLKLTQTECSYVFLKVNFIFVSLSTANMNNSLCGVFDTSCMHAYTSTRN